MDKFISANVLFPLNGREKIFKFISQTEAMYAAKPF
jgi:hypothetical protein